MTMSSNHTDVSVHCKHTVACSRTLLSDLVQPDMGHTHSLQSQLSPKSSFIIIIIIIIQLY
jgi:hypothetical protein